ncbi:MAG TPA: ABC transporter permease [Candidatus Woesearchaeota archaeon]|nr:ABC transporter permease [Candidatus Woesearchaeota archaeon]
MRRILEVIKKDMKLLMRSKLSSLLMLIGPLLIVFMSGVALDTQTRFNIKVGVFSPTYSALSNSYIDSLRKEGFVVDRLGSEQECIDSVRMGSFHACVVFSEGLRVDREYEGFINFYVDYSQINLAWIIKDILFTPAEDKMREVSKDLVGTLLDFITFTTTEISAGKPIVNRLTTINDKLSSSLTAASSFIDIINPVYDFNRFKITEFRNTIADVKTRSDVIALRSLTKFQEVQSSARNLKLTVASLNDPQVSSMLNPIIDDMIQNINSSIVAVTSDKQALSSSTEALSARLSDVEKSIAEIKILLESIQASKEKTLSYMLTGKQDTTNMLGDIFLVQKSLNDIERHANEIRILSSEQITEPFKTEVMPVVQEKTSMAVLFPTMLAMIIMFISIVISSTLMQIEKNSSAHIRNLVAPTKESVFGFGSYLTTLIILFVQVFIVLAIISLAFSSSISGIGSFLSVVLITFLSSSVFIILGILVGNILSSEESSSTVAILLSLFLVIFSGIIFPIEGFSAGVQNVLRLNPLNLSEYLFRQVLIHGSSFSEILFQMSLLVSWLLVLLIVLVAMQSFLSRNDLGINTRKTIRRKSQKQEKAEPEEYAKLKNLIDETNALLSPKKKISKDELSIAKEKYIRMLSLYQQLDKKSKQRIYDDLNLIHKKLSSF